MNAHLEYMFRTIKDGEAVIEAIVIVNAVGTNTATSEELTKFEDMPSSIIRAATLAITDFSSISGKFNIDHLAFMLDIDTTAEGPRIPNDHLCLEEHMIYDAHIAAPGHGIATHCSVCSQAWIKIGKTFYRPEENMHILKLEDVV